MNIHSPVVPTQQIYRQILQAISHPGRKYNVERDGWDSLLMAACATLLDHEVSFASINAPATWDDDIFSLTKARRTSIDNADYIIVSGNKSNGELENAQTGTLTFPDRSATIFYVMDSPLDNANAPTLSGPGIKDSTTPEANPLSDSEWKFLSDINSEYPLGVDALCLIGESDVIGIPRSTRIQTR